jgi:uncharacterized protein YcbX
MGAVAVNSLEFGHFGLVNDRRYMLVDEKNRFITQRSHPMLSQFHLNHNGEGWQVTFKDSSIVISEESSSERVLSTMVWKSPIQAREKSSDVSHWFSDMLDEWVCLVEFDDLERRIKRFHERDFPLSFADGYPLLVCNQASLEHLSKEVAEPLEMLRFRPNIVISLPAEQEFNVSQLKQRDHAFIDFGEPCVRCNVPAIDPKTSVYNRTLHQRLKTKLSQHHEQPVFGMNAGVVGLQSLSVGDEFEVVLG